MLGPTMLRIVGQQCCVCLHGPLAISTATATRIAQNNRFVQYLDVAMHHSYYLATSSKKYDVISKSFGISGERKRTRCEQTSFLFVRFFNCRLHSSIMQSTHFTAKKSQKRPDDTQTKENTPKYIFSSRRPSRCRFRCKRSGGGRLMEPWFLKNVDVYRLFTA